MPIGFHMNYSKVKYHTDYASVILATTANASTQVTYGLELKKKIFKMLWQKVEGQ